MVTDHQLKSASGWPGLERCREAPGRLAAFRAALRLTLPIIFALMTAGCQSTVDAGRSMRPVPQRPMVVPPSGPAFPSNPVPQDTTGVERQPVAAVLQLPQAGEDELHTVKAGETWSSVARQYQLTVQELTDANGIDPSTVLQPGQMIYIPEK